MGAGRDREAASKRAGAPAPASGAGAARRVVLPRALRRLLALQLLASALFVTGFALAFDYPLVVIPLHVAHAGFWFVAVLLALGALARAPGLRGRSGARRALVAVAGLASSALAVLYLADVASNLAWGGNVNFGFLAGIGAQIESFGAGSPRQAAWVAGLAVAVAALVIGPGALFQRRAHALGTALEDLFAGRPGPPRDRARAAAAKIGLVAPLLLFQCALGASFDAKNAGIWEGEPLASLALVSRLPVDAHRVAAGLEDQRLRAAYPAGPPPEPRSVALFMVDSLRADHMHAYGYRRETTPFLDELLAAGRLRRVELALATCSETVCGALSTLASRDFRSLGYHSFKLHDLLRDSGMPAYFLLSGDHDWYDLKSLYGETDALWDGRASRVHAINDDRLLLEGLERLPDAAGRPAFFYFHLMSAHFAGTRQEEHARFLPEAGWESVAARGGESQRLVNYYDNGVLQTDAVLRQLFAALARKGYLEGALVVILGDHGEALGEHGRYGHADGLYQEQIRIPLLLYDDPAVDYANLAFGTQIDVAPTVVDRLGLPAPASWQGRSLLSQAPRRFSFHQTHHARPWRAVVYRPRSGLLYKYLWREGSLLAPPRHALYELRSDPRERRDLAPGADPALLALLRRRLGDAMGVHVR